MAELERIGETEAFSGLLVRLLEVAGWHVRRVQGAGYVQLTATHGRSSTVEVRGATVAEVEIALFAPCVRARRPLQNLETATRLF